ncbi:MAG TPA: SsrA-binding protein SmpB [Opitutales bacterium]|nr:SsrA-binding protein SmpB [Opitutales bacterium]
MAAKKKKSARPKEIRNSSAFRDYFIEERFEAGIVLTGTEVKSIRAGRAQITEGYGRVDKDGLTLYHMHIAEYSHGNVHNHDPYRPRRLLLHRRELDRIATAVHTENLTIVPLRVYFKQGLVKVEIGLGRGKKLYDKREDLKKKAHEQEMKRALKAMRQ